ncbi:hypothetical protein [Streptomyces sp. CAU 1734]|uniref:hypothetical protein n=1 Tax=Streptomyces sp. CAU 1734 TaxID=3140360 RepID=UPI003260D2FE
MIPNSTTTDSEMATTDHILGRFTQPAGDRATLHTPAQDHRATNERFHAAS